MFKTIPVFHFRLQIGHTFCVCVNRLTKIFGFELKVVPIFGRNNEFSVDHIFHYEKQINCFQSLTNSFIDYIFY